MTYIDRFDRIKGASEGASSEVDWLYARGISGESEHLWKTLKDKVPLRIGLDSKPDLNEWCQTVYDRYVPDEYKWKKQRGYNKYWTFQSAGRNQDGEPHAVMLCSLQRWLRRNYGVVIEKAMQDNPRWKP